MDAHSLETLAELLLDWEEGCRRGEERSAAELAREHPGLVAALDARIRILKLAKWLDAPSEAGEGPNDGDPDTDGTGDGAGRLLAGRYRLDRKIATGGFAEVWLAHDGQLDRTVAIKLPRPTRVESAETVLAEARRVARLIHPHILPVHDVGIEKDVCFIVSDYLDGGSLADRLADGPVAVESAVRWIAQVAEALDRAHGEGVIHRDVKPANILLNRQGDAVLGDFGIARAVAGQEPGSPLGTLRYMSPEQFAGRACTPQSDIYSLAVVLHEAICGTLPYDSEDLESFRCSIGSGDGILISPTIPKTLAAVCRKALSYCESERHASAGEFVQQLRKASTSGSRIAWVWPGVAAVSLVCGIAGLSLPRRQGRLDPDVASAGAAAASADLAAIVLQPSGLVPLLLAVGDPSVATLDCRTIGESLPYVVEAVNIRQYREWQEPPLSYFGPLHDGVEAKVVYRFDFPSEVRAVSLRCNCFCVDFRQERGGVGRGASAVDVSIDGESWHTLFDQIDPRDWGKKWILDGPLPDFVQGASSIWLRVRMLTEGCEDGEYSCAQFGRLIPEAPTVLRLVAELGPETE